MKKLLLILLTGLALSFVTPKENTYTLTEPQMINLYNAIQQTKVILPTSQAPAITVTQLQNAFDSIQVVLINQYKNFHPDSTTKRK